MATFGRKRRKAIALTAIAALDIGSGFQAVGAPGGGWRAVGICLTYGLPILCFRQPWHVRDANEVTGPTWETVLRCRLTPA